MATSTNSSHGTTYEIKDVALPYFEMQRLGVAIAISEGLL